MNNKYEELLEKELEEIRAKHRASYEEQKNKLIEELRSGTNPQYNKETKIFQNSTLNQIKDIEDSFREEILKSEEYLTKSKEIEGSFEERLKSEVLNNEEVRNLDALSSSYDERIEKLSETIEIASIKNNEQVSEINAKISNLEEEIESTRLQDTSKIINEITDLNSEYKSVASKIENYDINSNAEQNDFSKRAIDLQVDEIRLEDKLEATKAKLVKLEEPILAYEEKLSAASVIDKAYVENAAITRTIQNLDNELHAIEGSEKKLRSEIENYEENYQKRLENYKAFNDTPPSLESYQDSLAENLLAKEKYQSEYDNQVNKFEKNKKKIEKYKEIANSDTISDNEYRKNLIEVKNLNHEVKSIQDTISENKQTVIEYQEKSAEYIKNININKEKVSALEIKLTEITEKISVKNKELESVNTNNQTIQGKLDKKHEHLNELKGEVDKIQSNLDIKYANEKAELTQLKIEKESLDKKSNNIKNKVTDFAKSKVTNELADLKKGLLDEMVREKSKSLTAKLYTELESIKNGKLDLTNKIMEQFEAKQNDILKKSEELKKEYYENISKAEQLKENRIKAKSMSKIEKIESNYVQINQHLKQREVLKSKLDTEVKDINHLKDELKNTKIFDRNSRKILKSQIKEKIELSNNTRKEIKDVEKKIIDIQDNKQRIARINNYVQEKSHRAKAAMMKFQENRLQFVQMSKNVISKIKDMNKSASRKQETDNSRKLS